VPYSIYFLRNAIEKKLTMKNTKTKTISNKAMMGVAAGVAAAAAGAYYLLGPKGKTHQRKAVAWIRGMTGDIKREVKNAKKITTPIYHKIVNEASSTYRKQYKENERDIKAFADKLKSDWIAASNKLAQKSAQIAKRKISSK
jgi:hypothetical protein